MLLLCVLFFIANPLLTQNARGMDARELVEASFDYWRGKTSIGLVDMIIHRPGWERVMTIKAWTKGQDRSLIKILAPAKDKGNGTLKKGREMWIFNPKINRVIKIPPSMMSQAWMGSDFSNNDLAKSDSLIKDYVHKITGTEAHGVKRVYLIESTPKPDAPVVWGLQRLKIREDHIFLEEGFFDEDLKLVKKLSAHDIGILGGRLFPRVWKMQKAGVKDEYTLLKYRELLFDRPLPLDTFTLSKLRLPVR